MFIIELNYQVPVSEIDANMAEHIEYLDKHYRSGHFLASGERNPGMAD